MNCKENDLIIVRGGGDIATGVIQKLHRTGFKVVVLEIENPSSIRRCVCLSEAIYHNEFTVEDVTSVKANNIKEINNILNSGKVPIIIDPHGKYINEIRPYAVVDCILAKKNLGTSINMANKTIGLGPGFTASVDVNIVIETNRGHDLGRLIFSGSANENTGIPGNIGGYTSERVLRSPKNGIIQVISKIGDTTKKGDVIGYVNNTPINATIDGILRGIIPDGYNVFEGMKIGDIDPRISEYKNCFTISDKARALGGAVLEAVMLKN